MDEDQMLWEPMDDWDMAMRRPPSPESIIAGHSNGGNGVCRTSASAMAIITGVRLAIKAMCMDHRKYKKISKP